MAADTRQTDRQQEDRIVGDWQQPINRWQGAENSIHTDAVARKIGMRGGTIPGTVHLTHFQPILRELFGERWLHDGSISMFYTFATIDREDVRAIVKRPPEGTRDVQLDAWVENKEGRVVCKGTVSVGKTASTPYVRSLPLENAAPAASRILGQMKAGMEVPAREGLVISDGLEDGVLRDPQLMFRALQVFPANVDTKPAVGFFGATEIILHNGPIRGSTPYRRTGNVICVGESPKTEFAWFDSYLHDKDGQLVAEMRHMTRWMKVSSPLWK
jgi:hypothetical protein